MTSLFFDILDLSDLSVELNLFLGFSVFLSVYFSATAYLSLAQVPNDFLLLLYLIDLVDLKSSFLSTQVSNPDYLVLPVNQVSSILLTISSFSNFMVFPILDPGLTLIVLADFSNLGPPSLTGLDLSPARVAYLVSLFYLWLGCFYPFCSERQF